jgi:autotransporter-associated beta strand protein
MSKGKKSLAIICGAVAPIFIGTSAFAGMTIDAFAGGIGNDWPTAASGGAPTSAVGSNPLFDTGDNGANGAPDGVVTNNSVVPGELVGETFNTGATGFNLGEIAVFGSGAPNSSISLHLFQMITQVTGSTGGYILSTAEVGHDLLGGGAGLSFTYAGGTGAVYEFVFNNSGTTDQVALAANTEYSFEFWNNNSTVGATGGFFVGRNGGQPYTNGQEFNIGPSPIAGALVDNSTVTRGGVSGSARNMSFAMYAAPPAPTWIGNPGDGLWTTAANWLGGIPNSAGISATFGTAITAATTVNLNGNETVGKINFNTGASYTIAQGVGGGTLTLDNAGNTAQINDLFGNHTISAPMALTSFGVTVAVGQSTNTLTLSGAISGTGGVTLNGTSSSQAVGTVVMSGANTYQGATTVNTGTLELAAPNTLPSTTTLTVGTATTTALAQLGLNSGGQSISGLTINAGSDLDVENNHIIISYAAGTQAATDATIRSYLISGYAGGTFTGTGGITSSTAAATPGYAVGYADGADGVVSGLSSGQIEIKYTLYGDANLDGVVSGDDFTILVGNLGKSVSAWDQGDFNYDGVVSGDDYTLLVGNLGKSATGADITLPAADYAAIDAFAAANGLMADVPEPASAGLLIVAGLGMLSRRRRSSNV